MGGELTLYPHRVDWFGGQVPIAHKAEAELVPLSETEPLRTECEEFVRCIITRQQPLTDGRSGLEVLQVSPLRRIRYSMKDVRWILR